jgi:glutaredoxin 3
MFLVYSKDGCRYCSMTIELLTDLKKEFTVIKFNSVAELNDALFNRGITVRTFPQVFLDDEHIGGYTELYARVAMSNYEFEIDDDCF